MLLVSVLKRAGCCVCGSVWCLPAGVAAVVTRCGGVVWVCAVRCVMVIEKSLAIGLGSAMPRELSVVRVWAIRGPL